MVDASFIKFFGVPYVTHVVVRRAMYTQTSAPKGDANNNKNIE